RAALTDKPPEDARKASERAWMRDAPGRDAGRRSSGRIAAYADEIGAQDGCDVVLGQHEEGAFHVEVFFVEEADHRTRGRHVPTASQVVDPQPGHIGVALASNVREEHVMPRVRIAQIER